MEIAVMTRCAALVLMMGGLVGCSGKLMFIRTADPGPRPVVKFEDVMMTYRKPMKPHKIVGRLETKDYPADKWDLAILELRQKAATLGLDGVCDLTPGGTGSTGAGDWAGNGFVWESRP
jgi:hypothetical protein